MEENNTKKCSCCGKELPLSEFNKCARNLDGLQYVCRTCQNERVRQSRIKKNNLLSDTSNPSLAEFTPRQLIEELKARGYKGKLT